jgi:hypothetical protein
MSWKVGDIVRTKWGLLGRIVLLTKDGISAYVLIINNEKDSHADRYQLDMLTKIDEAD